jgi:hypothetical protein
MHPFADLRKFNGHACNCSVMRHRNWIGAFSCEIVQETDKSSKILAAMSLQKKSPKKAAQARQLP